MGGVVVVPNKPPLGGGPGRLQIIRLPRLIATNLGSSKTPTTWESCVPSSLMLSKEYRWPSTGVVASCFAYTMRLSQPIATGSSSSGVADSVIGVEFTESFAEIL